MHEHVADEQDGDGGVELHARHVEVTLEIVEARLRNGVAVYVVLITVSARVAMCERLWEAFLARLRWACRREAPVHGFLYSRREESTYEEVHCA